MVHVPNLHKNKRPPMLPSIGRYVKTAMEIGAAAKGLFDIGCLVYPGVATYGPTARNGVRTIGPMVAVAAVTAIIYP